jgi:WD40 repeat protein
VLPYLDCADELRICDLCSYLPHEIDDTQAIVIAVADNVFVWEGQKTERSNGTERLVISRKWERRWNYAAMIRPDPGQVFSWASLAHYGYRGPEVICMTDSRNGSPVNVVALSAVLNKTNETLPSLLLPSSSPNWMSSSGRFSTTWSATDVNTKVGLMACCEHWLAASMVYISWSSWPSTEVAMHVMDIHSHRGLGHCWIVGIITALAVSEKNGEGFLVAGQEDGKVNVWKVPNADEECQLTNVLEGHVGAVTSILFGCNGSVLCTGSEDNTVRLWRKSLDNSMFEVNATDVCEDYRDTGSSSMCCDGSFLVFVRAPLPRSVAIGNGASLWNLVLGTWERSFYKHDLFVNCVALRGALLATSSGKVTHRGCCVQLWHAPTGAPLAHFQNPELISHLFIPEQLEQHRIIGGRPPEQEVPVASTN